MGGKAGGLVGGFGRVTNAIMTQVVAARNGNAIITILRKCLHKCLLSGEAEGRRAALARMGSFHHE